MRSCCAAKRGRISAGDGVLPSYGKEPTLRLRVFVGVEKESSGTVSANLNTPMQDEQDQPCLDRSGLDVVTHLDSSLTDQSGRERRWRVSCALSGVVRAAR